MNLIIKLRNLATKVLGRKNAILNYDIDRQLAYLRRFPEPCDDIERSYFQYKCQMKLYGRSYQILVNIIAPFIMIGYTLLSRNKNQPIEFIESDKNKAGKKAICFINALSESYIPCELREKYSTLIHAELEDSGHLTKQDLEFIRAIIKRYPFSWYFQLKILLKIGAYSKQIALNKPDAIIASAEYSFSSSIMTNYCRNKGIQHINIQHGEKMLYIEDAFFHFDKCFIWDEIYKDILIRLKAEPTQFLISIPPILTDIKERIIIISGHSKNYCDIKYYLASETKPELIAIKNTLERIKSIGLSVCIRPHPIYTDRKLVHSIFNNCFEIEEPKLISIEKSLSSCKVAVSIRSFVLQQAYYAGIKTAIDDVSLPDCYKTLEKVEYIMVQKSKKLSKIISKEEW